MLTQTKILSQDKFSFMLHWSCDVTEDVWLPSLAFPENQDPKPCIENCLEKHDLCDHLRTACIP